MDTQAAAPHVSPHDLPPQRPPIVRHGASRVIAWGGAVSTPNINLPPEAIDYFYTENEAMRSWRAAKNLSFVIGGRCAVSLGLGGIIQAFIPGPLNAPRLLPALEGTPKHLGRTMFHPAVFGLSLAGAIVGLAVHTYGVARFYGDTASINLKRARYIATAATIGALMVAGGGAQYSYAAVNQSGVGTWQALPVRAVGNFLVFACLPASFSSSEVVHGQLPLHNRILVRDIGLAIGGGMMLIWAQISAATAPPAPLWARELAQVGAVVGIAVGAALPRVDALNAQADARGLRRRDADPVRLSLVGAPDGHRVVRMMTP